MDKKIPGKTLSFIDDATLRSYAEEVLAVAKKAEEEVEEKIYSNVVDPFSALFDSLRQGLSLSKWLEKEKERQVQKTMQNALGKFHQKILGSIPGWEDMGTGGVVDIKNTGKKIIVEVKNKWNTTKGNHKINIYDDLDSLLKADYKDYTGYYVEVVPKNKNPYNKPFTPPDNKQGGKRRPNNEKIRVIDGRSFYAIASGEENALRDLYMVLPRIIAGILGVSADLAEKDEKLTEILNQAY